MKLNNNQKSWLMVAVALFVLMSLCGKSGYALLDGSDTPPSTGIWKAPRNMECDSSYSDSSGKFVCDLHTLK